LTELIRSGEISVLGYVKREFGDYHRHLIWTRGGLLFRTALGVASWQNDERYEREIAFANLVRENFPQLFIAT
jgi:hypothetical protein